tara:strand:+ start:9935 stop:10525 length:591 start_codon:yes stop_codon:yes gene_type:complete
MNWKSVGVFETDVSKYFGASYGIAMDSCTHGIELCLRYLDVDELIIPKRTYISIPFLSNKLNIPLVWKDENWEDYYEIGNTGVYDAAVLWKENSYIPNTFMCLSFQFQKHLSLGRGGMILTDNKNAYNKLKKMSYDGREPDVPWREQNIDTIGYHYYMTPETAQLGLDKLPSAIKIKPRQWVVEDWPDLTKMEIFK